MRCPYCGGYNADQANFCARCGRDLQAFPPPNQQRQGFPPPSQSRSTTLPPSPQQGQAQQTQVTQRRRPPTMPSQPSQVTRQPQAPPIVPPEPPAPGPPSQFPPHTVEQLQALEEGAQVYTVVHTTVGDGHKKIVRIVYPKCVGWQQVATLHKAFKEQLEDGFDSVIIQGVYAQDMDVYDFTNGQLVFDHGVRLGDSILNRYQIETGNGFEADSV
ncbi:MAG TPA: zinc ribbon domain-containing protein, partial [Ktedonobacteraceae bacterium]|nr:zinc ribbon domain-containing protein [Ktedonobacteraceae bacterium]